MENSKSKAGKIGAVVLKNKRKRSMEHCLLMVKAKEKKDLLFKAIFRKIIFFEFFFI